MVMAMTVSGWLLLIFVVVSLTLKGIVGGGSPGRGGNAWTASSAGVLCPLMLAGLSSGRGDRDGDGHGENWEGSVSAVTDEANAWRVWVTVPMSVPEAKLESLKSAVAELVGAWQPDDGDWDAEMGCEPVWVFDELL